MMADAAIPQHSWWQRRVVAPIAGQLRQGITPEKLALTIALGIALSVFPILGTTMLLCGLTAWRLRLNQPVIHTVNYVFYPVQIALLLPFYRAGETLFGQPHLPIFSLTELIGRFNASPWQFVVDYGMVGAYGIVVWCLLAPPVTALIYFAVRGPLRRMVRNRARAAAPVRLAAASIPQAAHPSSTIAR